MRTRAPQNDDGGESSYAQISIFNYSGRVASPLKTRWLDVNEFQTTKLYILLNTPEVEPYIK